MVSNVWEIDVDLSIIDEAAHIFFGDADDGGPFAGTTSMAEPYEEICTECGTFFAQRVFGTATLHGFRWTMSRP